MDHSRNQVSGATVHDEQAYQGQSAKGEETLHDLRIPGNYADGFEDGIAQSMALAYRRLASDLRTDTHLAPTFDDAVELGQRRTMRD